VSGSEFCAPVAAKGCDFLSLTAADCDGSTDSALDTGCNYFTTSSQTNYECFDASDSHTLVGTTG
jgi:hypothetical protein